MSFNINTYKTVDKNNFTHLSLRGIKFNIPKNKYNDLYDYVLLHPELSLCERLPEKFPFYLDIDGLNEDIEIEDVLEEVLNILPEIFNIENETQLTYYALRNNLKHRNFHIHFPGIMVNKQICKNVIKELNNNTKFEEKIYDEHAYNTCLRMYGSWKYNNNKKSLDKNSNYLLFPIFEGDEERYEEVDPFEVLSMHGFENNKLISFISEELNQKILSNNNSNKKYNLTEENIYDETFFSNKRDRYYYKNLKNNNWRILETILYKCLDKSYYEDRDKWIKTLYAMRSIYTPFKIVKKWSEQYKKHDQNRINQLEHIMTSEPRDNGHNIKYTYLLKEGRKCNEEEYDKILWFVNENEYFINKISIPDIKLAINNGILGDVNLLATLYENRIIAKPIKKTSCEIYYWNGDIWELDRSTKGAKIKKLFHKVLLNIYQSFKFILTKYKNDNPDQVDDNILDLIDKKIYTLVNTNAHISNVYSYVLCDFENINIYSLFNSNKDQLAVKNGNIDLRTGEIRERRPEDYNTFALDVEYNKEIDYSSVSEFFDEVMLDRTHLSDFLQTFFGYSITGHTSEQKICIMNGIGSNGKSLTMDSIIDLLNDEKYIGNLSGGSLSSKYKNGAATTQYNSLQYKRVAFLDESSKREELNEGAIKRMTGSKTLTIRKLYCEEESIQMYAQLYLSTNFIPKISDDPALHRRILSIPFDAVFKDIKEFNPNDSTHRMKKPQAEIKENLKPEKLLVWLVDGAVKWYKNGLVNIPEEITAFKENIIKKADMLSRFFSEELILIEEEMEYSSIEEIYSMYIKFSGESTKQFSVFDFKEGLKARKIPIKKLSSGITKLPYTSKF